MSLGDKAFLFIGFVSRFPGYKNVLREDFSLKSMTGRFISAPGLKQALFILLLLLIPFGLFQKTAKFDFINWDDGLHVYENPFIRSFDLENIKVWFKKPFVSLYIPIPMISYAVNYQFAGNDPQGYHLTNVFLHLLNILLAFGLLRAFFKDDWAAFLGALLFGIHPLQVESVAWISERKNLLFAFFALTAVYCFVENKPHRRVFFWALVFFIFSAAILSKVTAVMLPFIFLLCAFLFPSEIKKVKPVWFLVFLLPALAAGVLTLTLYLKPFASASINAPKEVLLYPALRLGIYLKNAFCPTDLSLFYPFGPVLQNKSLFYALLAGTLTFVLVTLTSFFKKTKSAFWLGWIWIWLAPVLTLLVPVSDHHFYLPLLGLIGAFIALTNHARLFVYGLLIAFNLACIPLTLQQLSLWENSETLWKNTLSRHPEESRAPIHLADFYREQGRNAEALSLYEKVIREQPYVPDTYISLTNLHLVLHDPEKAEETVALLEKNLPAHPQVPILRASIAQMQNDNPKAAGLLKQALALDPSNEFALINLGRLYFGEKDFKKASELFLKASEKNNPAAFFYLGLIENIRGHWPEALSYFDAMRARNLYFPKAYFQEGYAHLKIGQFKEAEAAYRRSTQADPEVMEAFFHLGLMKLQQHNRPEALRYFRKALLLNPAAENIRQMITQVENELTPAV